MSAHYDPPLAPADVPAQRLAQGFAEHVVRWAARAGCDEAHLPVLRGAAYATSLATSNGHVCILLSDLPGSADSQAAARQGVERAADVHLLRASLLATGVVGTPEQPGSMPLILDVQGRLCLHRYFDYEARLARRLMLAATAPPREVGPAARDLLDTLFPAAGSDEVDWQKIAAAMALRGSLTVISGGPGTGKTTTVVNLLACLLTQEPGTRVALAAPTGKAAARMTEAIRQRAGHLPERLRARLPQESFTIHRLLGANPAQGRFSHDAANPIPCDALIVDEASMLDLALATRLLEAAPASARIVLLGDKDQLASVEAGAVFAELSGDPSLSDEGRRELAALCGYAPRSVVPAAPAHASPLRDVTVWLTKNHRFPADSAIGRLARAVNEGSAADALEVLRQPAATPSPPQVAGATNREQARTAKRRPRDTMSLSLFGQEEPLARPAAGSPASGDLGSAIRWLDPARGDSVLEAILAGYAGYFAAVERDPGDFTAIFAAWNGFRVLGPLRSGPGGVLALNEQVSGHARRALAGAGAGPDAASPWYVGRPVMVLRNDHTQRLYNGDVGIALPAGAGGELALAFADDEHGWRAVPLARLPEHETAYAMTVHKAQGSEFDAVLLALPSRPSPVVTSELVYTAVTRAKQRVTVCGPAQLLAAAIGRRCRRDSGLRSALARAQAQAPPRPR